MAVVVCGLLFLFGSSRAEKLPLVGGHRVGLDGGGQRGGCTPRRVNDFFFDMYVALRMFFLGST